MSSKRERARQRAEALRREAEERARAERRRERLLRFGISGAVLVVVAVIAIALANRSSDDGPDGTGAIPEAAVADGSGVAAGPESAPVTIDYWFDFQCPYCADFEAENGPVLEELAAEGTARVVYHPAAFLGEESDRASNAFGCAVDAGRPVEYLTELMVNQPAEGSGGYGTDELVAAGAAAGIDDAQFESCVRDSTYADWGAQVLQAMRAAGVESTPAVLIDGEPVENPATLSAEEFRAIVEEAVTTS